MLSKDKLFKEALDFAIVNYEKIDIIYKCFFTNELRFPIEKVIDYLENKLKGYFPFRIYYKSSSDPLIPNFTKLIFFIPALYNKNTISDVIHKSKDKSYTTIELIDKLWLEGMAMSEGVSGLDPNIYISENYVFKGNVDNSEDVINSFDVFLPTKVESKKQTTNLLNMLLESSDYFNKEKINFFKYDFSIPSNTPKGLFLEHFEKSLKYAFECKLLINPDSKMRDSNFYEMFIIFPIHNKFNMNNFTIQNLIKAMWAKTLQRFNTNSLKNLFLLELDFATYDIMGDINNASFSIGLYRLNRKISVIYKSNIDIKYKNFIIERFK